MKITKNPIKIPNNGFLSVKEVTLTFLMEEKEERSEFL